LSLAEGERQTGVVARSELGGAAIAR